MDPFNPPVRRADTIASSTLPHARQDRSAREIRARGGDDDSAALYRPGESTMVICATLPDAAAIARHPSVARRMAEVRRATAKAHKAAAGRMARDYSDGCAQSTRLGSSPPAVRWSPSVRSAQSARFGRFGDPHRIG